MPTPVGRAAGVRQRQLGRRMAGFAPQPGDIVVKEHWGSSGFANTDLDMLREQHRIAKVIVIGLLANTCIVTTGRFAMEFGYHVTLVKDATAAFNKDRMHAGHELNGPTYAHAIPYYGRSGCRTPAGGTPRRNRIHRSRL